MRHDRPAASGTHTRSWRPPHVSWRYPNAPETIARLTAELNDRLVADEVSIEVLTGAEIAMTRAGEIDRAELSRLRLGEGPWLLLEAPSAPRSHRARGEAPAPPPLATALISSQPDRLAGRDGTWLAAARSAFRMSGS